MGLKAKVEAILFLNSNPLSAPDIANQANADVDAVRIALSQLVQDYEEREDSGLMIDTHEGYSLQVREDYETLSQGILEIALKTGCLRTLSVIALKEPIYQAELVDMRGGGAYEHIKELIEMGLARKIKEGHKHVLRTTPMFHEYFRMTDNGIELQTILKKHSDRIRFTRAADAAEDGESVPDGSISRSEPGVQNVDDGIEDVITASGEAELSELNQVAKLISEELSEVAVEHAL